MPRKSPKNDPAAQRYEMVRAGNLTPHPDNPNDGDEDAIGESVDENGFYGSCIAQVSTGRILIGNHRWAEFIKTSGEDGLIPVTWADVDDGRALAIMLSDNATRQRAKTDEGLLATILKRLPSTRGTGYQPAQVDALIKAARPTLSYLDSMRGDASSLEGEDTDQLDDRSGEEGPFDEEDEDASEVSPPPEHEDMPRHMLAIVLSNAELRVWKRAQERLQKKKDKDAFMAMLSLYDVGG
jgi:hypothetical protein